MVVTLPVHLGQRSLAQSANAGDNEGQAGLVQSPVQLAQFFLPAQGMVGQVAGREGEVAGFHAVGTEFGASY